MLSFQLPSVGTLSAPLLTIDVGGGGKTGLRNEVRAPIKGLFDASAAEQARESVCVHLVSYQGSAVGRQLVQLICKQTVKRLSAGSKRPIDSADAGQIDSRRTRRPDVGRRGRRPSTHRAGGG